ncbi:hypothetical protein G6F37_002532 [Rhizopus arrhizus]|nr:hypothetical protein G6F38_002838 [Rhizopus arrhizus]KAG1162031.1 hypothetical protein G6F37_002532 [Rhizopus arrhizus]
MGDIVGNRPLHLAVVSNNVDAVLALLEAGAKPKPEESETIISDDGLPSAIRERNQMTAPLDLATSRLNMLLKQVNTRSRDRLMNQVLKIIDLLKYYSTDKECDELDELTKRISGIQINSKKENQDSDILVMQSLRETPLDLFYEYIISDIKSHRLHSIKAVYRLMISIKSLLELNARFGLSI